MGMFDYLRCDLPLPKMSPEEQEKIGFEWQTKDLECQLNYYRITSGGILINENIYSTDRVLYNGDVYFYNDGYEYTAIFRNGDLVGIDLVMANGKTLEQHKEADEEAHNARMNKLLGRTQ